MILDRSTSYIGTLIDDLITKGAEEPYRIMTSRSEYRLVLRQDNADARLTPTGHRVGLISDERYTGFLEKQKRVSEEIFRLETTFVSPEKLKKLLEEKNSSPVASGVSLAELLRRPELDYEALSAVDTDRKPLPGSVCEQVEISIKYEGYIKRQLQQIEQFRKLEQKKLPEDFDYEKIAGLRLEARQKLNQVKPLSVGQAGRISGVNPADVSVLLVYFRYI